MKHIKYIFKGFLVSLAAVIALTIGLSVIGMAGYLLYFIGYKALLLIGLILFFHDLGDEPSPKKITTLDSHRTDGLRVPQDML